MNAKARYPQRSTPEGLAEAELESEKQGALASLTLGDRAWLLAALLLDNLEDDLARAMVLGWWKQDPAEMSRLPFLQDRILSEKARLQPRLLAAEVESDAVQMLYDLIRAATNGRVAVGRGVLIRNARIKAVNHATMRGRGWNFQKGKNSRALLPAAATPPARFTGDRAAPVSNGVAVSICG